MATDVAYITYQPQINPSKTGLILIVNDGIFWKWQQIYLVKIYTTENPNRAYIDLPTIGAR